MSLRSFHDLITHTPVGGAFKCELIMAGRGDKVKAIKSSAKAGQSGRKRSRRAETRKNAPRSAPGAERPITRANGADAPRLVCAACAQALEATPISAPEPPLGTVNRLAPAPIGRNAARESPHTFSGKLPPENRPQAPVEPRQGIKPTQQEKQDDRVHPRPRPRQLWRRNAPRVLRTFTEARETPQGRTRQEPRHYREAAFYRNQPPPSERREVRPQAATRTAPARPDRSRRTGEAVEANGPGDVTFPARVTACGVETNPKPERKP